MNDTDFEQIESALKIKLPATYRKVMTKSGADIIALAKTIRAKLQPDGPVFLTAKALIDRNLAAREFDDMASAFPKWQKTYVLVGTNNGGDYSCLKLDGKPGVWWIGTDCGNKPTKHSNTFQAHVDDEMSDLQFEADRLRDAHAAPILTKANWKKLKEAAPKFRELRGSYDAWEDADSDRRYDLRQKGSAVIAETVTATRFLKWCEKNDRKITMKSMLDFAQERLKANYPIVGTK